MSILNELLSVTFKDSDGTTDLNKSFNKRASYDPGLAEYLASECRLDPSLPKNSVVLKVTAAKASPNHFGVQRLHFAVRQELLLPTPSGETILPHIWKGDISRPVGVTPAQAEVFLNERIAIMQSDVFRDFYLYGDS